jgi:hypothetical protein
MILWIDKRGFIKKYESLDSISILKSDEGAERTGAPYRAVEVWIGQCSYCRYLAPPRKEEVLSHARALCSWTELGLMRSGLHQDSRL